MNSTIAKGFISGALAFAALALPSVAHAEAEEKAVTISGAATFVSDYRFRGVSLSNLDPAVQASIQADSKSGLYVGLWGSSIADYNGATTEVDIYAGWAGTLGPVDANIGVTGYLYPGGTGTDTFEFFATAGLPLGPVTATLGAYWAPDQKNLSGSSRYFSGTLSADIPNTPVAVKASLGNERGSFVADESGRSTSKWDWLIGADINFEPLTLGIAYVGNDLSRSTIDLGGGNSFRANKMARDGIVLSLSASF